MKKRLISILEITARWIPLGLYPFFVQRDEIDYFWHVVSDQRMPHVRHLYPVVSTSDFEDALMYLRKNHTFISYSQLHAHIFEGAELPPNAVHISFDDGYHECYSVVRPLLIKHRIPCTFFMTTGLIDNERLFYRNKQSLCIERLKEPSYKFNPGDFKDLPAEHNAPISTLAEFLSWFKRLRLQDEPLINEICHILGVNWRDFLLETQPYLTTDQILEMHAEGFTIGAHTVSHRKLVNLPFDEIETEIVQSCRIIGDITGQKIIPFSFPNSAWGLDRDHLSGIRDAHPEIGLLFDTKGIRRDVLFIHNRIWAERYLDDFSQAPYRAEGIKERLYQAYQKAWVDEIAGIARKAGS